MKMCNVFSGLIVTEKGKDWGKVLFLSGVHHEKDREKVMKKYGDNVIAWESVTPYSLENLKFTHKINVTKNEQIELLKLLCVWAKNQDANKLLRSMMTVLKNNKPTDDYKIFDNIINVGDNMSVVCDFTANIISGNNSTQTAGYSSTQTAGDHSTLNAGDYSTQNAGNRSTQNAGDYSTQNAGDNSTQNAGYSSTQNAGYSSTQTAGDNSTLIIHGDISYIILNGSKVLLIQIYYESNGYIRKIVNVDDLFEKYKVGDKIKIVKGEDAGKV